MNKTQKKPATDHKQDFMTQLDICNSCSCFDSTGLIPSLPDAKEQIESYESIYNYDAKQAFERKED